MNEKALAFHFSNPDLSVGCFRCFGSIGVVDKPCNSFGEVWIVFKPNEDYLVLPGYLGVISTGGFVTQIVWFDWGLEFISILLTNCFDPAHLSLKE